MVYFKRAEFWHRMAARRHDPAAEDHESNGYNPKTAIMIPSPPGILNTLQSFLA